MTIINDFSHFGGRHWETGSVHNHLAQRGFRAPHSGRPYSEALLLGISGGITVGYFTFAYAGYDPQCNILTRNTFDPLDRLLTRLGGAQTLIQTRTADKAAAQLQATLADGIAPIVWAEVAALPYNGVPADAEMYGALPLVVFGADDAAVHIADRAGVPLTLPAAQFAAARARVKKIRFRMLTVEAPDPAKLAAAVRAGIHDTLRLYLEKPPKGAAHNFGLAALAHWADNLRRPTARTSWARQFARGRPLFAGLTSAFEFAFLFGKGSALDAERGLYADFLLEAAQLLQQPALVEAADAFRAAGAEWRALAAALLPDACPPLATARRLLIERHNAFLERGVAALPSIAAANAQLADLRAAAERDFPLDAAGVTALHAAIADRLDALARAERAAVLLLRG